MTYCSLDSKKLAVLYRNARQLLNTIQATFPKFSFEQDTGAFNCDSGVTSGLEGARCAWLRIQQLSKTTTAENAFSITGPPLLHFSRIAQDLMSSTASNYNVFRLSLGLLTTGFAAVLAFPGVYHESMRSAYTGFFLAFMVLGYGAMMFASSYVEEEQQFWYWICSAWSFYLHIRWESSRLSSLGDIRSSHYFNRLAILGLATSERMLRRWNQTGQKFTSEPDISRTYFPSHPTIFWTLVILTYLDAGHRLARRLPPTFFPRMGAWALATVAFMFKLNFVANDAPELLVGSPLLRLVGMWPESLTLVWQARFVFGGLLCYAVLVGLTKNWWNSAESMLNTGFLYTPHSADSIMFASI